MENLLYTITQYLSNQGNKIDEDIAVLLTYAKLKIEETGNYSSMNWYYQEAMAILEVPYQIQAYFTNKVLQRITEVLQKFKPIEWKIDFCDTRTHPQINNAYSGWQVDILNNISRMGLNNQAIFNSSNHQMYDYKGLRFRSQTERIIMIEFEKHTDILVCPLPAVICGIERKEPDFLVIKDGKFAILEIVSDQFHQSVVSEANRTQWFQNHHVQIRSYDATRCYRNPEYVVNEFVKWLEGI